MEREKGNSLTLLKIAAMAATALVGLIMFKSIPQLRRYLRIRGM